MDMSSLFPTESGMNNIISSAPTPHVSFKAGTLSHDTTTNLVTADPRKGVFQVITSGDDGLTHLQWRPKNSSTFDPDYIIFPGDAEMKQVTSCPASARVYVVKWREGNTRLFFWMQGKDPSADAPLVTSVNNILLRGPDAQQTFTADDTPQTRQPTANTHTASPSIMDIDIQPQPSQPDSPPSSSAPATALPASGQITLQQMRQALESRSRASPTPTAALEKEQRELIATTPTVGDLLSLDNLRTALADNRVQEAMIDLFQHLPEQDRSVDAIEQVLRSPPLRTQAAALSQALQSEQAAELLRSFELPMPETEGGYGLQMLLDALLKLEKETRERRD